MEAVDLLKYKGSRQLFNTLLAYPARQFTVNELAKTAGLPFTTTWKLVKKFERANVVQTTLVGRSRAVKYKESPFTKLLKTILELSVSTQKLSLNKLKKLLKTKKEVESAYLFGSVAEKREKLESDIDVALLIKGRFDLHPLIEEMYDKYGVKVVPLTFEDEREFLDFLKDKKKVKLV